MCDATTSRAVERQRHTHTHTPVPARARGLQAREGAFDVLDFVDDGAPVICSPRNSTGPRALDPSVFSECNSNTACNRPGEFRKCTPDEKQDWGCFDKDPAQKRWMVFGAHNGSAGAGDDDDDPADDLGGIWLVQVFRNDVAHRDLVSRRFTTTRATNGRNAAARPDERNFRGARLRRPALARAAARRRQRRAGRSRSRSQGGQVEWSSDGARAPRAALSPRGVAPTTVVVGAVRTPRRRGW